mgnify:CR=1 FL=1
MKKHLLLTMAILASCHAMAEKTYTLPEDTTKVIDIEEVVVIASPKETSKLRQLPTSVSLISQKDMQANRITSLKSASSIVPNFFIPDYGSRLTSAMYIRGIGSRINTPAVGMYVDNIPYLDKSAFDFNFYDIERIDILRGPQGTLYGRNTMGGLVKVHTRSPFSYQGTDVKLSYGNKNNHRSASLTHYHRISERFAFSAGGYYEGADGFFTNTHLNKKVDEMQAGGGRIRAIWFASDNWKFDFNVNYDYTDEGGYPYYYTGKLAGEEDRADLLDRIAYNRESSYRRSLLNTGLNIEHQAENFIFNAVTGFQHLNDRMHMDQDFSPMDTYTIEQKQRINSITEEITFKSKPGKAWQWTTGVFGFYQNMNTNGPVIFYKDGIDFLNTTINGYFPDLSQMGMNMSLGIKDESLSIPSTMKTPSWNTAIFHQSTFHAGNWELSAGLRLEYENMQMDYNSSTSTNFDYSLSSRMMPIELKDLKADYQTVGKLKNDYIQLLPKVAVKYNFNSKNNFYASISKGHRSGGYNVQMFSDIVQNGLQNSIKTTIKNGVGEKLNGFAQMGMPSSVIGMINGMMEQYLTTSEINIAESTTYKPEYSWNYEVGSHLQLFNGKLQADFAAFYMDTRNQQIAKFAETGLGRITVNAGESESYGVEANLVASLNKNLQLNASYGYTKATFVKYDAGKEEDYSGNYVPFVPRHTMNIGGSYAFLFNNSWAQSLTLGANVTGAGKIYWTEANNASQDFYTSLNGYISLKTKAVQIDLWGRNLTNNDYTTFYFETMGRGYEQRCKPLQIGVDVRLHF